MKLIELDEIFSVTYGNKLDLNKMKVVLPSDEHSIAFIARTRKNNGIVAYVEKNATINPYKKGSITVALGGSILSTFIQYEDFYTAQNIAVLIPKVTMNECVKAYYCKCINANAYRYSTCGREANKTLKKLLIPKFEDIPQWILNEQIPNFENLTNSYNDKNLNLNINNWRPFKYKNLFSIERGLGPRKQDLENGIIPFVTSTDTNNGISAYTNHIPMHKGNTLSVNRNGSIAEAFYQEKEFCSTEDVHIFNPKFELNKYIAMFLITLIKKEKYRYSYGRKWGIDRMNNSIIYLPVIMKNDGTYVKDNEGNYIPDWQFIENYIKSLPYSRNL